MKNSTRPGDTRHRPSSPRSTYKSPPSRRRRMRAHIVSQRVVVGCPVVLAVYGDGDAGTSTTTTTTSSSSSSSSSCSSSTRDTTTASASTVSSSKGSGRDGRESRTSRGRRRISSSSISNSHGKSLEYRGAIGAVGGAVRHQLSQLLRSSLAPPLDLRVSVDRVVVTVGAESAAATAECGMVAGTSVGGSDSREKRRSWRCCQCWRWCAGAGARAAAGVLSRSLWPSNVILAPRSLDETRAKRSCCNSSSKMIRMRSRIRQRAWRAGKERSIPRRRGRYFMPVDGTTTNTAARSTNRSSRANRSRSRSSSGRDTVGAGDVALAGLSMLAATASLQVPHVSHNARKNLYKRLQSCTVLVPGQYHVVHRRPEIPEVVRHATSLAPLVLLDPGHPERESFFNSGDTGGECLAGGDVAAESFQVCDSLLEYLQRSAPLLLFLLGRVTECADVFGTKKRDGHVGCSCGSAVGWGNLGTTAACVVALMRNHDRSLRCTNWNIAIWGSFSSAAASVVTWRRNHDPSARCSNKAIVRWRSLGSTAIHVHVWVRNCNRNFRCTNRPIVVRGASLCLRLGLLQGFVFGIVSLFQLFQSCLGYFHDFCVGATLESVWRSKDEFSWSCIGPGFIIFPNVRGGHRRRGSGGSSSGCGPYYKFQISLSVFGRDRLVCSFRWQRLFSLIIDWARGWQGMSAFLIDRTGALRHVWTMASAIARRDIGLKLGDDWKGKIEEC